MNKFFYIAHYKIVGVYMKKIKRLIFTLFSVLGLILSFGNVVYAEEDEIYLGGMTAGFSLLTRGAYVMGISDVLTDSGIVSPAKSAGITVGDVILSINGQEVNDASDIEKTVTDQSEKMLLIDRCGESIFLGIIPAKDTSGKLRLGIFIRESVNGIGTVTFIKGNRIASLGHHVSDRNGNPLAIRGGTLYGCEITGIVKGERGVPGELRGVFVKKDVYASVDKNLYCGVYGEVNEKFDKKSLRKIDVGVGKMGEATIFSSVNGGEPKEYKISIIKAVGSESSDKNFVIRVTDKELLDLSGGIVQGMSGSPILQNGKLVGAVTHVFINDPTRGFGISVENMINN